MNSNGQAVDNWFSEADESVQSSMIDGSMYSPCDALTVEGVGIDESLGTEHVVVTYEIQLEKPIRWLPSQSASAGTRLTVPVPQDQVMKRVISKLRLTSSSGIDNVTVPLLRTLASDPEGWSLLSSIIRSSILDGTFPSAYKKAFINPIPTPGLCDNAPSHSWVTLERPSSES